MYPNCLHWKLLLTQLLGPNLLATWSETNKTIITNKKKKEILTEIRRHLGDKKNNRNKADIILRGKYQPSSQAPFLGDWEQGNIFYDVNFIGSAVCNLQMSYTGTGRVWPEVIYCFRTLCKIVEIKVDLAKTLFISVKVH